MRKMLMIMHLFLFMVVGHAALAQEDPELCSPEYISQRIDAAIQAYQAVYEGVATTDEALNALNSLQEELQSIEDICANLAVGGTKSTGTGTLQDPYTFGTAGNTDEGFEIQITGLIRPADTIIRNENRFNDRPGGNEVYIILELTIMCDESFSGRCETNYFDFELVGSAGTIYKPASVVYDDRLDVALFAGGTGTGSLPFLINADDTDLKLLYRSNMFRDEFVAYEATPSLANGIEITSNADINVRSGPGTNFPVSGNLSSGSTAIAFGRNSNGTWLQIQNGWVFAELVTTSNDVNSLPTTAE